MKYERGIKAMMAVLEGDDVEFYFKARTKKGNTIEFEIPNFKKKRGVK